jgi:hypothetical protein
MAGIPHPPERLRTLAERSPSIGCREAISAGQGVMPFAFVRRTFE